MTLPEINALMAHMKGIGSPALQEKIRDRLVAALYAIDAAPSHPPATPAVAVQAESATICPTCRGSKVVRVETYSSSMHTQSYGLCGVCHGTGFASAHPKPAAPEAQGDLIKLAAKCGAYVGEGVSFHRHEFEAFAAALPSPAAPATADDEQWIAEAKLTLDRLGAFLQNIGAPHAVDWREWIDNAEKHVLALRSGASAQPAGGADHG